MVIVVLFVVIVDHERVKELFESRADGGGGFFERSVVESERSESLGLFGLGGDFVAGKVVGEPHAHRRVDLQFLREVSHPLVQGSRMLGVVHIVHQNHSQCVFLGQRPASFVFGVA